MSSSCTLAKEKLLLCISKSPCADRGGTVKECVSDAHISEECLALRRLLFECRRGQLDNRNRLRGNRWAEEYQGGATGVGANDNKQDQPK
mmetsp:Transcript_56225/g.132501  ORF Transcript_56225/g.132501 Transcript_56225/m.132501 type:complete len:90 (+) Transcript_56225:161-430(+)